MEHPGLYKAKVRIYKVASKKSQGGGRGRGPQRHSASSAAPGGERNNKFAFGYVVTCNDKPELAVNGENVFIPPNIYANLLSPESGQIVDVEILPRVPGQLDRHGRPQDAKAVDVVRRSRVTWDSWRLDTDEHGGTNLVNTVPGSKHDGFEVACWSCGAKILAPEDIWKLKNGAVWTKAIPSSVSVHEETTHHNDNKGADYHITTCKECSYPLGTAYMRGYQDEEDPTRKFPCCKLDYRLALNYTTPEGATTKTAFVLVFNRDYTDWAPSLEALETADQGEHSFKVTRHTKHLADQVQKLSLDANVHMPPKYWEHYHPNVANRETWKSSEGYDAADATARMGRYIERLMNNLARPKEHGIGRDSHGAQFKRFKVLKVEHIANRLLWEKFSISREHIVQRRDPLEALPATPITEAETPTLGIDVEDSLEARKAHEVLLFHGTKAEFKEHICTTGFNERVFSLRGLFGGGCYFADSPSKSDQYIPAKNEDGTDVKKCLMFISRVCLGNSYGAAEPCQGMRDAPYRQDGVTRYDSVTGLTKSQHPNAFLARFPEFIIYDGKLAYPEWLVTYARE